MRHQHAKKKRDDDDDEQAENDLEFKKRIQLLSAPTTPKRPFSPHSSSKPFDPSFLRTSSLFGCDKSPFSSPQQRDLPSSLYAQYHPSPAKAHPDQTVASTAPTRGALQNLNPTENPNPCVYYEKCHFCGGVCASQHF